MMRPFLISKSNCSGCCEVNDITKDRTKVRPDIANDNLAGICYSYSEGFVWALSMFCDSVKRYPETLLDDVAQATCMSEIFQTLDSGSAQQTCTPGHAKAAARSCLTQQFSKHH